MVKTFPFLIENESYYFDAEKASRAIAFIEKFCKLSDPRGQPFKLLPWQKQVVNDVFGWYSKETQERRFVYVYVEVPRKNGKTYFVAALLIFLLMGESKGAELYASACTKEQSGLLFKSVVQMIQQSKFLRDRLRIVQHKKEVQYANGDGVLKALSGESKGSHGKYPSAICCDELHEWTTEKSTDLYEALTSGWGNRRSPLALHITTAGFGSNPTLAKKLHEKSLLFERGECNDPTFYGVVYGAEPGDDWKEEKTWEKANPSYHLAKKNLKREFQLAKSDTAEENKFKRLYLNLWTQQQTRWLDLEDWDKCVDKSLTYDELRGGKVVLGLDLSEIYDLTALTLNYPMEDGSWKTFVKCFMPLKQVAKRSKEDGIPYEKWVKDGWIVPTEGVSKGQTVDYQTVIQEIEKINAENEIITLGYDPNNAVMIIPQIESKGIHCTTIFPRFADMSPASKEFRRRLSTGEIKLEDNPCLRWQAGNVEITSDGESRIRPVKPNAKGSYAGSAKYKVDGIISTVIAIQATLLACGKAKEEEVYKPSIFYVSR